MGVVIVEEGAVLGVNLGRSIVTNVELLREPIELSFGLVSVVSPGIGVLDGGRRAARRSEWRSFGRFRVVFSPISLNGALLSRTIRLVCEKFTLFPYGEYIVGNVLSLAL